MGLRRHSTDLLNPYPIIPMHRWMDDLRFYVLFNSIAVISGRWADDNEWNSIWG